MGNSEVEEICRAIYRKHQKALDLIFQYKPDINLEISEYLQNLLKEDKRVIFIWGGKSVVQFITEEVESLIKKISKDDPNSNRVLYFEFRNYGNRLALHFLIGPGDKKYREKFYEFFKARKELFSVVSKILYPKYHTIYQKKILNPGDYEEASIDQLSEKINEKWEEFCHVELIKINEYLNNEWEN